MDSINFIFGFDAILFNIQTVAAVANTPVTIEAQIRVSNRPELKREFCKCFAIAKMRQWFRAWIIRIALFFSAKWKCLHRSPNRRKSFYFDIRQCITSTNSFSHNFGHNLYACDVMLIRYRTLYTISSARLTQLITFRLAHHFGGTINHFHAEYQFVLLLRSFQVNFERWEERKGKKIFRDDDVFL